MSEAVLTHEHHHHDHDHHHASDDGYMAVHAEDLYGRLVRKHAVLDYRDALGGEELDAIESKYNLAAVHARTAATLPRITEQQKNAVYADFHTEYPTIPRQEHDHHHHDHDDGCGKRHGPIRKFLEGAERGVSNRFKSQRAKVAVALLFRAGFFTMCPGDDIAAIGLQVYGSISGSHTEHEHDEEHGHAEVYAVLPRRPRMVVDLDGGRATVDLPLSPPVPHAAMPKGRIGETLRETVVDVGESPTKIIEKSATKPRSRMLAFGLMALSCAGLLAADTAADTPIAKEVVAASPAYEQPEERAPRKSQSSVATKEVVVKSGDSQWKIAEGLVGTTDTKASPERTQSIAAYIAKINKKTNPNPDFIAVGQKLAVPTTAMTEQLLTTLGR